jgi:hypothetical protein
MLGAAMKIKKVNKVNPVAKASRHKSGAGAHKSKKDYDRKVGKEELLDLLRAQQAIVGTTEWIKLEEEIQNLLEKEDGE